MRRWAAIVVAIGCGGSSARPDAAADAPVDAAMIACAPGDGSVQPVCMFDHLCWEYPLPTGEAIRAIAGGGCDYWLAGDGMYRLHGATLSYVATPFDSSNAVQVFPTEVWAAGPAGVARFDGAAWTTVDAKPALGVWGSAANDIWVSRLDGMAHWDGSLLTHVETTPLLLTLAQVWGTGPTDVRVVVRNSLTGFLHWDGKTWTSEALPGAGALAVWGDAPDDWYAATKMDGHAQIWRFDGAAWSVVHDEAGAAAFRAIWGSSRDDVWVAGGTLDHVLHFDGTTWASIALPAALNIDAIHGSGRDDVVFYGTGFLGRWNGVQIESLTSASPLASSGSDWSSLYAPNENERWLVARNGTVMHWDGATWSSEVVTTGVNSARTITGTGPDDVWLGGGSGTHRMWHRTGGTWAPVDLDGDAPIVAMHAAAVNDVWAVDAAGGTYHYDGAWSMAGVIDDSLTAVWGAATDAWAVGGALYHWDGASWTIVEAPGLTFAFSVWGRASDDVYFGDQQGMLLHWDGQAVDILAQVPDASILSIGGDATRLWLVGKGIVAYDDGNGLRVFREGRHTWRAAAFPSAAGGWIVGSSNSVLRYQP